MAWVAPRVVLFTAVLLVLLAAALLVTYYTRRKRIAAFARSVTRGSGSTEDAVFALARTLYVTIQRRPDPKFPSFLAPLGASPVAVLRRGGCCAGIHRLFITALDTLGVPASQVTVYRPGPDAAHCLAQVQLGNERLMIDVDYGISYRRPDGQAVSMAELRAGMAPVLQTFMPDASALRVQGNSRNPPGYPGGEYFAFDYRLTRTANWTMSRVRRLSYAVLHALTDGRIDDLQLPPLLEWPEILLAVICCAGAALLLAITAIGS